MKNYYEILEVDKHASIEIIDKAYKVLAKKYHPDMHMGDKKTWAEEHFKKISEAYEVLSDESKRISYDQELEASTIDYSKKYEELCIQQEFLKQELQTLRSRYQTTYNNTVHSQSSQQPKYGTNRDVNASQNIYYKKNITSHPDIDEIRKQEFNRAYNNILHNLGYTIRQKKTFKDFLAFIITICLIIGIIYILWNIPFTKNYLVQFYESNDILKGIVDFLRH